MVRKINNRLYKINTYASEMIVEVDDNYDEEVQKLRKEIQLETDWQQLLKQAIFRGGVFI